jgi:hypothetical protein
MRSIRCDGHVAGVEKIKRIKLKELRNHFGQNIIDGGIILK